MRYRFYISRLPLGESEWEWTVGPELLTTIGSNYDIQDLKVQVKVQARRETQYLRLLFSLEGWVEVPCDRGQELIRLPIKATHEQIYGWDEHYLPPEGTEEYFMLGSREDEIDLTQSLYDYIGLSVPWRRVRPECPDEHCPAYVRIYLSQD
ncbi:MAG: DUF177 domain-containing protein [Bacteroidia bacterium]|nr:DUF177 domain-containing protein [Bacteroidia bacterium]